MSGKVLKALLIMATVIPTAIGVAAESAETAAGVIVGTAGKSPKESFALKELQVFLKQSTGKAWPVTTADRAETVGPRIFVGAEARKRLPATAVPPATGESVVRIRGNEVFLYGAGPYGDLYAVYDFLENTVGCRWFSIFGEMQVPQRPKLTLKDGEFRTKPAFAYRWIYPDLFFRRPAENLFLYRNRINVRVPPVTDEPGIGNELDVHAPWVHTLFYYLPPHVQSKPGFAAPFSTLPEKDYFVRRPEFFSLNEQGVRTDVQQLCFSNPQLRKELTANIERKLKEVGGQGVITVDANDRPGTFCCCPACRALEQRYGSPAGPLFDYLIELCAQLKKDYPKAFVKTLAYRKEQSQKPPRVKALPDNLIVILAPIDDNFAADWKSPSNRATLADLAQWRKLAAHVWVWYYPNPYVKDVGTGVPFGNIDRLITDFQLMKKVGVEGVFVEQDTSAPEGFGFTELQNYLLTQLLRNPDRDFTGVIAEFMKFQYGPVASEVSAYLVQLERLRKAMKTPISWNPSSAGFRYLTPKNLAAWEKNFMVWETRLAGDPRRLFNLRKLRACLDMTVLQNWPALHRAQPEVFRDPDAVAKRLQDVLAEVEVTNAGPAPQLRGLFQHRLLGLRNELQTALLLAKNPAKPLPVPFASMPAEKVVQLPADSLDGRIADPAAAFGLAAKSAVETPFRLGFYDVAGKRFVLNRALAPAEIVPGKFHCYKLGTAELTPDCLIWLCASSWRAQTKLERFYQPGIDNCWDLYASVKFEGPAFDRNSRLPENRVTTDRIILVKH